MNDLKNTLTNVLGFVVIVVTAVNAYFQNLSGDINWVELIIGVVLAVGSYIQGKDKNVKAKVQ